MSVHFFHNHTALRKFFALCLIFGVGFLSIPAPMVFADEIVDEVVEAVSEPEEVQEEAPEPEDGEDGQDAPAGEDGKEGNQEPEEEESVDTENTDDAPDANGPEDGEVKEETQDGTEGEDATQGDGEVVIATGDAEVDGDVTTVANTNKTNSSYGDTESEPTHASTSTSGYEEYTPTSTSTGSTTHIIDPAYSSTTENVLNDNQATSTTAGAFVGTTGANAAAGGGSATIVSGDAFVTANVVNVVNTNIIDSQGMMVFLDQLYGDSAIDLRDEFDMFGVGDVAQSTCSLISCAYGNAQLNTTNNNDAVLQNDIMVRAETGGNGAYAGSGNATVVSGDAFAAANVFNVANTNIIDSNYLLVGVNANGAEAGDIVFPGMEYFLSLMSGTAFTGNTAIANNNEAQVNNNTAVVADTGANEAVAHDGGVVATGDATTNVAVVNQVNQNFINSNSIYMLFRVYGDWSGNIFGLPEGLTWEETPEGIVIRSAEGATAGVGGVGAVAATNNNRALINNNVQVYALTGENRAESENGEATVVTGDAYAGAGIYNIANTNVVGSNWVRAIFNIFGDWDGNISFGQPNLWIGGRAEAIDGSYKPGKRIEYTFRVTNFGDAVANNVVVRPDFNSSLLQFVEGNEKPTWVLGNLKPGESREISYRAQIADRLQYGHIPLVLNAKVTSTETDGDPDDNTEELTVMAFNKEPTGGNALRLDDAKIEIEKRVIGKTSTHASSTVSYEVVVKNKGGAAYHSILRDTIYDAAGNPFHSQIWELDTIYPDEEIYITYDVFFRGNTKPGVYTNKVSVEAIENHPSLEKRYGNRFRTPDVEASITILASEGVAQVADVSVACDAYLTDYIQWGKANSPVEVAKLQQFLNQYEGHSLPITGVYDRATYTAVHALQKRYADDILYPWGVSQSTGFVYFTTQKKINELYCEGSSEFPLSPDQLGEIEQFKGKLEDENWEFDDEGVFGGIGYNPETDFNPVVIIPPRTRQPSGSHSIAPSQAAAAAGTLPTITMRVAPTLVDRVRDRLDRFMHWITMQYSRALTMSKR